MAQKKSSEVDAWLARPDTRARIVLIYGPDHGLVAERGASFAKRTGLSLDDPFTVIRLDGSTLAQEPGRLTTEARTVPMFGGDRLIWIRNLGAEKGAAEEIGALLADPPQDALVLLEAGDLKKAAALRAAVETSPAGMALPCFADEGRSIDQVIDEALAGAGMTMRLDARQALRQRLGGDRLATRGELDKLVLYAAGQSEITVADIEACSGDVSADSSDQAVDAALAGDGVLADRRLQKALEAGVNPQTILLALQRQMQTLETLRRAVDHAGASAAAAVASSRPPVFFSRKRLMEEVVASWSGDAVRRVLERLQSSILESRRHAELAQALTRQSLLTVAAESARGRRHR